MGAGHHACASRCVSVNVCVYVRARAHHAYMSMRAYVCVQACARTFAPVLSLNKYACQARLALGVSTTPFTLSATAADAAAGVAQPGAHTPFMISVALHCICT